MPAYGLLIGHIVVFCVFGIINPMAVPQMGLIVMWVTVLLCGSGMYFSARFKHTTTAVIMNFALAVVIWGLFPLFLVMICEITRSSDDLLEAYMNANPIYQAAVVMDATAQGGWRIGQYHWCNFQMGAIASTIFLANMAAFHIFIGFLFVWRAMCRLRRRII